MLDVSNEFPASVNADSLLTVDRAMNLGPGVLVNRPLQVFIVWYQQATKDTCFKHSQP